MHNDSDTIETTNSVKNSKFIHVVIHVLIVFLRASTKERSKPLSGKDQNKACKALLL